MDYLKQLPMENEHREYKRNRIKLTKDLWETISAFENTDGGVIVLGITEKEEREKSFEITGVQDPQQVLDDFWSAIGNIISYKTISNDDVKTIQVQDMVVIEINVNEAPDNKKPVYSNGQMYIRQGSVDSKATREQKGILLRQSADDLDTKVLKNYNEEDLNIDDVRRYKEILGKRKQYKRYRDMDIEKFLIRIGVKAKDYENDGKYGITAGGLLFFGENNAILHTFPHFQLDYFDRTNPSERWNKRISSVEDNLNIFSFFESVTNAIKTTIPDPFELDSNLRRLDTGGEMEVALREAIINMLMHADYYGDAPIKAEANINFYNFTNPGKMKIPSQDFFTTNSTKTRNPVISKLFVQMGDGERAGQGGEKIYEAAVTSNFRLPNISTNIEQTNLKIWKVAYLDSFDGEGINDNEKGILKSIMASGKTMLSHKEIENSTGLSRAFVTNALNSLMDKGILIKYGKARSTKYGIPSSDEQLMAQLQIIPSLFRKMNSRFIKKSK